MLLQDFLILDYFLVNSQKLDHVEIAEKGGAEGKEDDAGQSHDAGKGDDESEEESEDLFGEEEEIEDLIFVEFLFGGKGLSE